MPTDLAARAPTEKASLYTKDILRLAASLPHADALAIVDAQATRRSPVCGSEITAEVKLDGAGRVEAVAFRARACAMGQASAALLRSSAAGKTMDDIAAMRGLLAEALSGARGFDAGWPEYTAFEAARDHPGRHAAILLPFDALLAAAEAR